MLTVSFLGLPALFQGHVFLPQPAFFQMPLVGASPSYASLMQHAGYQTFLPSIASNNDDYMLTLSSSKNDTTTSTSTISNDERKRKSTTQTNATRTMYDDDNSFINYHHQPKRVDIGECHYHHYPSIQPQPSVDTTSSSSSSSRYENCFRIS